MSASNSLFAYEMPTVIQRLITKEFCQAFKTELDIVFPANHQETVNYRDYEDTSGWASAFVNTAMRLCPQLKTYWDSLEWYDSDMFSDKVSLIMEGYDVIRRRKNNE